MIVLGGGICALVQATGLAPVSDAARVAHLHASDARVTCNDWVGTAQVTPGPLHALGMSFSLPQATNVVGSRTQDGLLFAKFGVHLLPNHAITIRMIEPRAGLGGMGWAPGAPDVGTLHFNPCRSTPNYDPVAKATASSTPAESTSHAAPASASA